MKIATLSVLVWMDPTSSLKTGNLRSLTDTGGEVVTTGLPLVSVSTNGVDIPDEPKILGDFSISSGGETSYAGNLGIELRGSSSLVFFPKKTYGFETRDSDNLDMDVSLLGLPEEEDWILNGPYSDKTLVRNVLIYDLSRDMGRYASRTRFVDLNINGAYQGIYVLMEKLKRDAERINVSKLDDTDITGGYVLKIDRSEEGNLFNFTDEEAFVSQFGSELGENSTDKYYLYDYPKPADITQEQKTYISGYVTDFETALASASFTDPVDGYASYIDVDSFVDYMILNEISNNVDAYRLSTFMHKEAGGKLKMGPIWDFNLGFGNAEFCLGDATDLWGYRFNTYCDDDAIHVQVAFWWVRLVEDPAFVARFQTRWNELRVTVLSEGSIFAKIDSYVDTLEGSLDKNFQKWDVLGTYIWPNTFVGETYADEVGFLKSWISDRLVWMDDAITSGAM